MNPTCPDYPLTQKTRCPFIRAALAMLASAPSQPASTSSASDEKLPASEKKWSVPRAWEPVRSFRKNVRGDTLAADWSRAGVQSPRLNSHRRRELTAGRHGRFANRFGSRFGRMHASTDGPAAEGGHWQSAGDYFVIFFVSLWRSAVHNTQQHWELDRPHHQVRNAC